MTAEVHRLTPAGPAIGPERKVIEMLEALLAEAKRGEIKGIAVCYVCGNEAVTTDYASGCADSHQLLAGTTMLHYRITKLVVDDA